MGRISQDVDVGEQQTHMTTQRPFHVELMNYTHQDPVIHSTMSLDNYVYSSSILEGMQGTLFKIDFEKSLIISTTHAKSPIFKTKHSSELNALTGCSWNGEVILLDDRTNRLESHSVFSAQSVHYMDFKFPNMIVLTKQHFSLYDVRNGRCSEPTLIDPTEISSCVALHPLRDMAMIGTTSGKVMFYSFEKSRYNKNGIQYMPHREEQKSHSIVNSINIPYKNFWQDGSIITTASNGVSSLWNYKTCRKIYDISINEQGLGNSCGALNEDHSIFAFAVTDRAVDSTAVKLNVDSSLVFYPISTTSNHHSSDRDYEDVLLPPTLDSVGADQPLKTNTLKIVEQAFSSADSFANPKQPSYISYLRMNKAKQKHSEKCHFNNFHYLPNELIGNILEYLQASSLPLLSSVSKQFRECIFEKLHTLIINRPMHGKFYTSFLPEFVNIRHLIFKGIAVRDVSLLISHVRNKVVKLTLILPKEDVLAPQIHIENLLIWSSLSELVIYNSRHLQGTKGDGDRRKLQKLHLINCMCDFSSLFELIYIPSLIDVNISGSNLPYNQLMCTQESSLKKLVLSGGSNLSDLQDLLNCHKNIEELQMTNMKDRFSSTLTLPTTLRSLNISNNPILPRLKLPLLTQLMVDHAPLDQKQLGEILEHCPLLTFISAKYCKLLDLADFRHRNLTSISLFGCVELKSCTIYCQNLTFLNVGKTLLNDESIANILKNNHALKQLHTSFCTNLIDPFHSVPSHGSLMIWNVGSCAASDAALFNALQKVPTLQILKN